MGKINFTISGNDERVISDLTDLAAAIKHPEKLLKVIAYRLVVTLKEHFLLRNQEGNKHGWPSKNFWKKEGADKVSIARIDNEEAIVTIASPAIAFKTTGGTIHPKRGKALAIPLTAEAYKAGSPRELPDNFLQLIKVKGHPPLLVTRAHTKVRWGKKGIRKGAKIPEGQVWYMLVKSVNQKADPQTLPDNTELEWILYAEADRYVEDEIAMNLKINT